MSGRLLAEEQLMIYVLDTRIHFNSENNSDSRERFWAGTLHCNFISYPTFIGTLSLMAIVKHSTFM